MGELQFDAWLSECHKKENANEIGSVSALACGECGSERQCRA
jgi:hypothetical protein